MGMDVYGRKPTQPVGEYFRCNYFKWPSLWGYCCSVSALARQVRHGYSNDGDGLEAAGAASLSQTLEEELEKGRTREYIAQLEKAPAKVRFPFEELQSACNGRLELPSIRLTEQCVRHFAQFLKHCGGFAIW